MSRASVPRSSPELIFNQLCQGSLVVCLPTVCKMHVQGSPSTAEAAGATGKQSRSGKPLRWKSRELLKPGSRNWQRSVHSVRLSGRRSGACKSPLLSGWRAQPPSTKLKRCTTLLYLVNVLEQGVEGLGGRGDAGPGGGTSRLQRLENWTCFFSMCTALRQQ